MIFRIVFFVCLFLLNHAVTFCSNSSREISPELSIGKSGQNQITNSIVWGAIGDSLGAPVEFIRDIDVILCESGYNQCFLQDNFASVIQAVKYYYKNRFEYLPYTDDTRMSLLVSQVLSGIYKNGYCSLEDMQNDAIIQIANAFKKDSEDQDFGWIANYRAPGNSTIDNISRLSDYVESIYDALLPHLTFEDPENNLKGGGCGSVMRAAPFGYFEDFWKMAGQHSIITHNHPIAITSCTILAKIIDAMIHKNKDKIEIYHQIINDVTLCKEENVCPDDITSGRYEFRMNRILQAACKAALLMEKIRAKNFLRIDENSSNNNPYLVSFHKLMRDDLFREKHTEIFPFQQWKVENYNYDEQFFSGWDAATCLAAAWYNFYLWIPEDINDENQYSREEQLRCMTNAITSAMFISGDSDSVAAVTGQLCGAFIKKLIIPNELVNNLEDYKKMVLLANGGDVDLFDHSDKKIVSNENNSNSGVLGKCIIS